MMLAAWYESKGAARDVLQVGHLPEPTPGPDEVRVRVNVSAVNPSDTKQRFGRFGNTQMPFPLIIPHQDGAGIVESVGSSISPKRIGERVWVFEAQRDGRAFGTAAEYVVVPAENAVPLPSNASFEDGASLGIPGMTAHRLLFRDGGIQGQTVLVAGGAGSVGHMAVQLARWAGARVIATTGSDDQAKIALQCGAHYVFDYTRDDLSTRLADLLGQKGGIDRVIEVAFTKNADLDAKLLKPNGIIATYAIDQENIQPSIDLQQLLLKGITVHFTLVYAMSRESHELAAKDLNAALTAGALKPHVAARYPLEKIADVHDRLDAGGIGGKALIQIMAAI